MMIPFLTQYGIYKAAKSVKQATWMRSTDVYHCTITPPNARRIPLRTHAAFIALNGRCLVSSLFDQGWQQQNTHRKLASRLTSSKVHQRSRDYEVKHQRHSLQKFEHITTQKQHHEPGVGGSLTASLTHKLPE